MNTMEKKSNSIHASQSKSQQQGPRKKEVITLCGSSSDDNEEEEESLSSADVRRRAVQHRMEDVRTTFQNKEITMAKTGNNNNNYNCGGSVSSLSGEFSRRRQRGARQSFDDSSLTLHNNSQTASSTRAAHVRAKSITIDSESSDNSDNDDCVVIEQSGRQKEKHQQPTPLAGRKDQGAAVQAQNDQAGPGANDRKQPARPTPTPTPGLQGTITCIDLLDSDSSEGDDNNDDVEEGDTRKSEINRTFDLTLDDDDDDDDEDTDEDGSNSNVQKKDETESANNARQDKHAVVDLLSASSDGDDAEGSSATIIDAADDEGVTTTKSVAAAAAADDDVEMSVPVPVSPAAAAPVITSEEEHDKQRCRSFNNDDESSLSPKGQQEDEDIRSVTSSVNSSGGNCFEQDGPVVDYNNSDDTAQPASQAIHGDSSKKKGNFEAVNCDHASATNDASSSAAASPPRLHNCLSQSERTTQSPTHSVIYESSLHRVKCISKCVQEIIGQYENARRCSDQSKSARTLTLGQVRKFAKADPSINANLILYVLYLLKIFDVESSAVYTYLGITTPHIRKLLLRLQRDGLVILSRDNGDVLPNYVENWVQFELLWLKHHYKPSGDCRGNLEYRTYEILRRFLSKNHSYVEACHVKKDLLQLDICSMLQGAGLLQLKEQTNASDMGHYLLYTWCGPSTAELWRDNWAAISLPHKSAEEHLSQSTVGSKNVANPVNTAAAASQNSSQLPTVSITSIQIDDVARSTNSVSAHLLDESPLTQKHNEIGSLAVSMEGLNSCEKREREELNSVCAEDNHSTWVQCDKCEKWRRLRGIISNIDSIPAIWDCSLNVNDPSRNSCAAPEEDSSQEHVVQENGPSSAAKRTKYIRRIGSCANVEITQVQNMGKKRGRGDMAAESELCFDEPVESDFCFDEPGESEEPPVMNIVTKLTHTNLDEITGFPKKCITVYNVFDETLYNFQVHVRTSTIPNSGRGAFLTYTGARKLRKNSLQKIQTAYNANRWMVPFGHDLLEAAEVDNAGKITRGYSVRVKLSNALYGVDDYDSRQAKQFMLGNEIGFYGLHSESDYVESSDKFSSLCEGCGLIDLGRYGPFLPTDRKTEFEFSIKSFVFADHPGEWGFGVSEQIRGSNQTIDITDDATGEPHRNACQQIPMYVNEVGYSRDLKQNVFSREAEDRVVRYYFYVDKPMAKGDTVELLSHYDNMFEPSRERKGYGLKNLFGGVKSDEDIAARLVRNVKDRLALENSLQTMNIADFQQILHMINSRIIGAVVGETDYFLTASRDNEGASSPTETIKAPLLRQWIARRRLHWLFHMLKDRFKNVVERPRYQSRSSSSMHVVGSEGAGNDDCELREQIVTMCRMEWTSFHQVLQWKNELCSSKNNLQENKEYYTSLIQALEFEMAEELLFVAHKTFPNPFADNLWCPLAIELQRNVLRSISWHLAKRDCDLPEAQDQLMCNLMRHVRGALGKIPHSENKKENSTVDVNGTVAMTSLSHLALTKGACVNMLKVTVEYDCNPLFRLKNDVTEVDVTMTNKSTTTAALDRKAKSQVIVASNKGEMVPQKDSTTVFDGIVQDVTRAEQEKLEVHLKWYVLKQLLPSIHGIVSVCVKWNSDIYSLSKLCSVLEVQESEAMRAISEISPLDEYELPPLHELDIPERKDLGCESNRRGGKGKKRKGITGSRTKMKKPFKPKRKLQKARVRTGKAAFFQTVWPVLKEQCGWNLDVGNRPGDHYYLPPGVHRGRPFRPRKDHFDSQKLVMNLIKTDARWRNRPEIIACVKEFEKSNGKPAADPKPAPLESFLNC